MASLTVGGVLLLTMIAASARGAVRLAADARIPVHYGSVEHCLYVSKRVGLVIWAGARAVLFGVLSAITGSRLAAGWVPGVRDVLVPAVLCVTLGFQVRALVMAARSVAGPGPAARYLARRSGRRPLPFA